MLPCFSGSKQTSRPEEHGVFKTQGKKKGGVGEGVLGGGGRGEGREEGGGFYNKGKNGIFQNQHILLLSFKNSGRTRKRGLYTVKVTFRKLKMH